jgi:predicted secreted protein
MIRSNNYIFLSHCLLAQGVKASGLVKEFPAVHIPIIQFCLDNNLNIIQMPCPEVMAPCGGINRKPKGKAWYEEHGLREISKKLAKEQAAYMKSLIDNGKNVLGIVGVEFSPACATRLMNKGRSVTHGKGIFVEELILEMSGLNIPLIGLHPRGPKKILKDLNGLLTSKDNDE